MPEVQASSGEDVRLYESRVRIGSRHLPFENLFIELNSLAATLNNNPHLIDGSIIDCFFELVDSNRHIRQKQAFFLYKAAADALVFCVLNSSWQTRSDIISRLQKAVLRSKGKKQRAISEAIGTLPIRIKGPKINISSVTSPLDITFARLCETRNELNQAHFQWHGRTLRFNCEDQTVICVKFARTCSDIEALAAETAWMKAIKKIYNGHDCGFHVPDPVQIDGYFVFKLTHMPQYLRPENESGLDAHAIIFHTNQSYYDYPNETSSTGLDYQELLRVFELNAGLTGALAAKGIVHTALIPLFHNRVQQARRQDHGHYLWEHGGRLDQWLDSCRYPNISSSGLRDFEHFESLENSKRVQHYIGEHLLGFILLIGSCFRNLEPDKKGFDDHGNPLDQRHLFDPDFFDTVIRQVVCSYFTGFTGKPFDYPDILYSRDLIASLINVMGVDKDMEESLRIQDQNNMTQAEFEGFLTSRGMSPEASVKLVKGQQDIRFQSGPHLGGFNQPISVPELIEMLFCLSSICVSDRYLTENGLKGPVN